MDEKMIIKPKKNIKFLNRLGHWITNSRRGYLTMERNERVDEFSNAQLKKLFKNLTSFDLRTYPENSEIYFKISKYESRCNFGFFSHRHYFPLLDEVY